MTTATQTITIKFPKIQTGRATRRADRIQHGGRPGPIAINGDRPRAWVATTAPQTAA